MGVGKGVTKGRNPEKHLLGIAEINLGRGATPKLGNVQKKGCLFLGFIPSYYMSTVAHRAVLKI